jgi:hypothetical protein
MVVKPGDFATRFDVVLTPLPCILGKSSHQQQSHYRRVVCEINAAAEAANKDRGRRPVGVAKILAQNPHFRPDKPDQSPAPLVHAHDSQKRDEYLRAYRVFVTNFRAGVERMLAKAKRLLHQFPDWAFPPALPFKAAAAAPS